MSDFTIRKGFLKKLEAMPGVIDTAFENEEFDPTDEVPYQTVEMIAFPPSNPTYGGDFYRENGFLRIRIHYPTRVGEGAASQYAQTVRSWFKRGSSINEDGIDIVIQSTPLIGQGVVVDDRYTRTIDVEYFANICN